MNDEKKVLINEKVIKYKNKKKQFNEFQYISNFIKILYVYFPFLYRQDRISKRAVFISSENNNNFYGFSNRINNKKYNFLTFVPVVILNQFRFFGNQFYLIMTLSQFINVFKVGFLFSYVVPLLIVIIMSLIKELLDEIKRYNQDKKTNNEKYTKIVFENKGLKKVNIKSKDIKIGDILELKQNQRAPCDLIILSNSESNNLYIRTEQLDGETDWKIRKVPNELININLMDLFNNYEILIEYEPPNRNIYEFKGVINFFNKSENCVKDEAISLENTIWANTVLASANTIGIAVYTGRDTRAQMNTVKAKLKVGIFDLEINFYNKLLFGIMFVISFIVVYFKECGFVYRLVSFCRFIVLFCGIIPISLRVNLDISKGYFSYLINNDEKISGTIVRNSSFPEDLGRVSYLFSDKTGTLTKNKMIFKVLAIEGKQFEKDDLDLEEKVKNKDLNNENLNVFNCVLTMVLCNNVTPILNKKNEVKEFQASSPDEISLVEFAANLGVKLVFRSDNEIHVKNVDKTEKFEILACFPFSSETKRMGIVVRDENGKIFFYCKGAENVMRDLVFNKYKNVIDSTANDLAKKGLRTLVLSRKELSNELYEKWRKNYDEAKVSMVERKKKVQEVVQQLEVELNFLGVTGVEDLLQDDVKETIQNLRQAGVKVWMLTGDKSETAKCISVLTGLKDDNQKVFEIKFENYNNFSRNEIIELLRNKLNIFNNLLKTEKDSKNIPQNILLIEGKMLDYCLSKDLESEFFRASINSPSVICCRCSPTQKAQIVSRIKRHLPRSQRTAAIGDGGNDVSMILKADVGIGVVGKEGLQASLSSDFSITEFSRLNDLLLWHGSNIYKNSAKMSNFIIHRGLIISFIQMFFSCAFYFNSVALYNGFLILGYSTVYTIFPSMSLLLDVETKYETVKNHPDLYKILLKGRELNIKNFLGWFWRSVFQGSVIIFGSICLFGENIFLKIVTITFTELIFAEILNVYVEIRTFNKYIYYSLIGTGITYLLSLVMLKDLLNVYYIFDFYTLKTVFLIAIVDWLPVQIFVWSRKIWVPNLSEKYEEIDLNIELKKINDI